MNFVKFLGKLFCRTTTSHMMLFFPFCRSVRLQLKIIFFGGAMVNQNDKSVQSGVVMEIRWKLHCQVVATHIPTQALEVKEKEELKNLSKWGKFSFYVMVDCEIFTYLKNKKQLILIVNKKVQDFRILNGIIHHVLVDGIVWYNPLIF